METLEIGSGQTPQDWEHEQELRREELRGDVRMAANFFFIAAAGAAVCSGVSPVETTFFVDVGFVELARMLSKAPMALGFGIFIPPRMLLSPHLAMLGVAVGIMGCMILLGIAGRSYKRWAFWAGLVIYGIDSLLLMLFFSFFSLGLHGFFLWKWWEAQRAIKNMTGSEQSPGAA